MNDSSFDMGTGLWTRTRVVLAGRRGPTDCDGSIVTIRKKTTPWVT